MTGADGAAWSWPALLFLAFIVIQRLVELAISRRNTVRLLATGGREFGARHYPLIVAVHVTWIGAMIGYGWSAAVSGVWLGLYAILQVLRVWIITSLGRRWTTRIIIVDEPVVTRGPYRYMRHPNYALVVAEVAIAPMVLGLVQVALVFTVLNAIVLAIRIPAENRALARTRITPRKET